MTADEPLPSLLDQMAAERKARIERKAAERALFAVRRRHGIDRRNAAKLRRLNEEDAS